MCFRLSLILLPLITFAGCHDDGTASTDLNPSLDGSAGDGSASGGCKQNSDCKKPDLPVCNTDTGACVQCFGSSRDLCTGATPRCEVDTCVACVDDGDCGTSGVCLPSGACADPASVIHAASNGASSDPSCGAVENACTLTEALAVVTTEKNVIKLNDAGPYTAVGGFTVGADVTIDARGATLHRADDGPIVTIDDNVSATILGGTLSEATGTNGDGVQCRPSSEATLNIYGTTIENNDEYGILSDHCTSTVTNSIIRNNGKRIDLLFEGININQGSITISRSLIAFNRGGGIYISNGTFDIVSNIVINNGNAGGSTGGINIFTSQSANKFEFNLIIGNLAQQGVGAGVQCIATVDFTGRNNIIWNNDNGTQNSTRQIGGSCPYAYSDIGPTDIPGVNDPGNTMHNINVDPMFVDEMADLHLTASSPVRGNGDPASDLSGIAAKDFDGELRVLPLDIGADQYYPR
jgi:hypothetical protein